MKTAMFGNLFTTISGTFLNGILGIAFYVTLARFLGPEDFGSFTLVTSFMVILADVADLGVNSSLIRFLGIDKSIHQQHRFIYFGFKVKLTAWFLLMLVGFMAMPFISGYIFHKPELCNLFRLSLLGVGGAMLFSTSAALLQAMGKFRSWSVLFVSTNFLRLVAILFLAYISRLDSLTGLIVYILFPFLGFVCAVSLLPIKSIISSRSDNHTGREFIRFSSWAGLTAILSTVTLRADTLINASLLSSASVGLYAAASQLTGFIYQVSGALGVVAAPAYTGFSDKSMMLNYYKKLQLIVIGLALIGLAGIPAAYILIPGLYGTDFAGSINVFNILLVSVLIFLIAVPAHEGIRYYFKKPEYMTVIFAAQLSVMAVSGFILAGKLGIIGTAYGVLMGSVINIIASWYIFDRLSSEKV